MEEQILCGVMRYNNEVIELYCDQETGDVSYTGSDSIPMLVGMLSVTDPMAIETVDKLLVAIDKQAYGQCIGVVQAKSGVYVLTTETTCEKRTRLHADVPTGDVIDIDLNMCLD